jgi:hypothetical protein
MSAIDRRRESLDKLHDPNTADNMQARKEITARMLAGEITLEQAQAELKAVKAAGRKAGKAVWGAR